MPILHINSRNKGRHLEGLRRRVEETPERFAKFFNDCEDDSIERYKPHIMERLAIVEMMGHEITTDEEFSEIILQTIEILTRVADLLGDIDRVDQNGGVLVYDDEHAISPVSLTYSISSCIEALPSDEGLVFTSIDGVAIGSMEDLLALPGYRDYSGGKVVQIQRFVSLEPSEERDRRLILALFRHLAKFETPELIEVVAMKGDINHTFLETESLGLMLEQFGFIKSLRYFLEEERDKLAEFPASIDYLWHSGFGFPPSPDVGPEEG